MGIFIYKARDIHGKPVAGELAAENIANAQSSLSAKNLFPVYLAEKSSSFDLGELINFNSQPKAKDLANITRQFEVMFSAGMQIDKILALLAQQVHHKGLKQALTLIKDDVASGMRLSEAFKKHPKIFSPLYTNMVEMGQSGGILDKTLREMAKILTKEHYIQSKVKGALLYPKIVALALVGVFWAMLTFVFPAFMDFYAGFDAELPLPTRIMIMLSTITTKYWYLPIIGSILLFFGYGHFKNTPTGERWLSLLAFNAPVFGKLNKLVANSRFGHLTSALYRAGVSLPYALHVVAGTVNNFVFAQEIESLKEGIEEGKSLSECLKNTQYFSPMIREACAVGEQTGKLDSILDATATYYDEESEEMVQNLTTLIEPIMIFVLFGAVLLLALAVYMPIWNMSKTVL